MSAVSIPARVKTSCKRRMREPDPSVVSLVSRVRATTFRAREFTANHRTFVILSTAFVLVVYSFLAASVQAYAAEQSGDIMASFKQALVDISGQGDDGTGRTLLESTHFLAWDRWTGFNPSGGTYYLVSAGSALSTATNFISSLFFTVSGFILKATGLVAAIGLSFDAVFSLMGVITRNFRLVTAIVVPSARSDYERVCNSSAGECGIINSMSTGNIIMGIAVVMLVIIAYKVTKDRRRTRASGDNPIMAGDLGRQIVVSIVSLLLFGSMGFASLSGNGIGVGSPTWYARGVEWVATKAAGLVGDGTNFTSVILTGRSIKTGPAVGGACSDYIGAMHTVFQGGTSSSSSRDQFLIALDELALNSYFRLAVNSSYGSVDDSSYGGAGNAWCHRLETDAGVSGAEHMLITRIALAQNNSSVQNATTDFKNYPLAAAVDANVGYMLGGSDEQRFAASRSISNMWGPYTSTDASNEAAFYFAACNTSYPKPTLLETWGDVISADAIKTSKGLQAGGEDGGNPTISIPIGGTTTSKIYLDGSRTLADIDAALTDAGGLCGAIPAGSVVRDPSLSKGTSGVGLFKYIGATVDDALTRTSEVITPFGNSGKGDDTEADAVQDAVDAQNKRNNEIKQGWSSNGYRSAGDQIVANAPDNAVDYGLLSGWKETADTLGSVKFSTFNGTESGNAAVTMYNAIAQADPDGNDNVDGKLSMLFAVESANSPLEKIGAAIKSLFGIDDAETAFSDYIAGIGDNPTDGNRLAAKAAITGFSGSGYASAQALNFREPDVEFLGMGIKKMSSAAPLFAAAIETGPYDYYLAVIGGNTVSTLVSAVCALILSVAIAYFLLPIVIGIVISKLIAVIAWFALPFTLLLNIIPVNNFRSLLKISIYSILWSHLSTTFFTAVLKVMSLLIVVFNSILYNPSHPVIIQTVEIMFAILASFGIMKFVLKQYFKVDFTSFKGAIMGAGVLSGKAIFDSIGKPLGLAKNDDHAYENAMGGGDLKKAMSSLFNNDAKKQETEDQKKADDTLTNAVDPEATKDSASEGVDPTTSESPDEGNLNGDAEGKVASDIQDTLLGDDDSEPKTDEEAKEAAEDVAENIINSSGLDSADQAADPEEASKAFEESKAENAVDSALAAMEGEDRTAVDEALTGSEVSGGGTDAEMKNGGAVNSIYNPGTGGGIKPENTYSSTDDNDALGFNNKFNDVIRRLDGDLSDEDRVNLERASEISASVNNGNEIDPKDRAWVDEHQARFDELFEMAGVEKVNNGDIAFSGSGPSPISEPAENPARLISEAIDRSTALSERLSNEKMLDDAAIASNVESAVRESGRAGRDLPGDADAGIASEIRAAASGINDRLDRLDTSLSEGGLATRTATLTDDDPAITKADADRIVSALDLNSENVAERLQELVDQGKDVNIDGQAVSAAELDVILHRYLDEL